MDEKDFEKLMELLEACAKAGRPAWEKLAAMIDQSEEADEIQMFLGEIAEGEI